MQPSRARSEGSSHNHSLAALLPSHEMGFQALDLILDRNTARIHLSHETVGHAVAGQALDVGIDVSLMITPRGILCTFRVQAGETLAARIRHEARIAQATLHFPLRP
jgi:hypothetical protein